MANPFQNHGKPKPAFSFSSWAKIAADRKTNGLPWPCQLDLATPNSLGFLRSKAASRTSTSAMLKPATPLKPLAATSPKDEHGTQKPSNLQRALFVGHPKNHQICRLPSFWGTACLEPPRVDFFGGSNQAACRSRVSAAALPAAPWDNLSTDGVSAEHG